MDLNVMTIGFTGAGKTSYLAAIYKMFNSMGYFGFKIRAINLDEHAAFTRIGDDLSRGLFPEGTDIRDKYVFVLSYNNEDLFYFNWTDYRGGVLDDRNDIELPKVVGQIVDAEALVVFIDITDFIYNPERALVTIKRIRNLIQNAVSKRHNEKLVISIILSKADAVSHWWDWRKRSKLKNSLAWQQYKRLEDDLRINDNIHGLVAHTTVGTCCENIEYPFLVSMELGLGLARSRINKEKKEALGMAAYHFGQSWWGDSVAAFLKNTFTDSGSVKSQRQLANEKISEYIRLDSKLGLLTQPLKDIRSYLRKGFSSDRINVREI